MSLFDEDIIVCSKCGAVLDRHTLYSMDCICMECGHFIDLDEMEEKNMEGWESSARNWYDEEEDYWSDYDYEKDDYYIEMMKRKQNSKGSEDMIPLLTNKQDDEDEVVQSFIIRFISSAGYSIIKESFEKLDADIDYLELCNEGPITKFINTKSGEKLLTGLKLNKDIEEYVISASFIFGDGDESKKILISTLCQSFPLCIIREEESSYIMANNKGLAKGLIDICNEDEIEIMSLFLTGYEKFLLLSYFLFWCDPYKSKQSKDIMVKWDNNALLSLDQIRSAKTVPTIWQQYLAPLETILVSKDDKDSGTHVAFEQMLEDVVDLLRDKKEIAEDENIVNVISLRGMANFSLYEDGEDNDIEK